MILTHLYQCEQNRRELAQEKTHTNQIAGRGKTFIQMVLQNDDHKKIIRNETLGKIQKNVSEIFTKSFWYNCERLCEILL